jgi:hypothetical protein
MDQKCPESPPRALPDDQVTGVVATGLGLRGDSSDLVWGEPESRQQDPKLLKEILPGPKRIVG